MAIWRGCLTTPEDCVLLLELLDTSGARLPRKLLIVIFRTENWHAPIDVPSWEHTMSRTMREWSKEY
jgi:hypothetical protein